MGLGFPLPCQPESRRLLLLMGITVGAVLAIQYIEFPYASVLPALFSSGRVSNHTFTTGETLPEFGTRVSPMPLNNSNSTYTNVSGNVTRSEAPSVKKVVDSRNEISGQDGEPHNEYVSQRNKSLNSSFGLVDNQTSFENLAPVNSVNGILPEKASQAPQSSIPLKSVSRNTTSSKGRTEEEGKNGSSKSSVGPPSFALAPRSSIPNKNLSSNINPGSTISANSNRNSMGKGDVESKSSRTSMTSVPDVNKKHKKPKKVVPISEMNNLLRQSQTLFPSKRPKPPSTVDLEILRAKSDIENAPVIRRNKELYAPVYRNLSMFKRSYELMETMLKVYIYREGEKPIFHQPQPILVGIYASEGWFMKQMEANKHFVTEDPKKAHLFYLPFSSRQLELTLYVRNSHKRDNLVQYMKNYVGMIAAKYPFWNRTGGADHFLAACHDWAPAETRGVMLNCIRALCNADINVGFSVGKDVSLPETYVRSAQKPLKNVGGNPTSRRPILAFFAGNLHGDVRPILLKYWGNTDPDMKIFGPMPHVKGNRNYIQHMKSSKYCICAKGYEVNSPRVVEAIFYECVPVIISDSFVPPFFGILNWESFAVFILEKNIPKLKDVLLSISEGKYREMHKRVKKVQKHFLWHDEPVKYDIFHMILHSVWYSRLFQINPS